MKKILAIALFLVIASSVTIQAQTATIAFDSSSNFPVATVSSAMFSHITSGSDRILFVGVLVNANPGNNVTGATYAGVPMIQIGHHSFGGGNFGDYVFMLVNPALGDNNVVVSLDSAQNMSVQSVSYTGVRQTGQPDNLISYGPGGPTTGIVTNSITTVTDNSWLVEWNQPRTPVVSSGGSVIRVSISGQLGSFLDSGVPQTPLGSHSISFSNNGVNDFFGGWLISIAPSGNNPLPTTTNISSTSVVVGSSGFTLTVGGTNFISNSVVQFDGLDRSTTFVNSTQLTAQILTSDLDAVGMFSIRVFNPSPGGGLSNPQTFTVTPNPIDNLDVPLSTRNAEATQILIKNKIDNLDILLSALRDAITAPSPNNKNLKDLFDQLQFILNQLDVALSTRASESTLLSAKNVLDSIKTKTDNIDVLLSTRASEATQLLVKNALDAIKAKTDNLDVLLSTRASEATQLLIKSNTDTLLSRTPKPWQFYTDSGKGFGTVIDGFILSNINKTDVLLIKNPPASGIVTRLKRLYVSPDRDFVNIEIYRNPTITANGTPLTPFNHKVSGSPATTQVFQSPVISSRGTLVFTGKLDAFLKTIDFELARFLEVGENMLVVFQADRANIEVDLTLDFAEE